MNRDISFVKLNLKFLVGVSFLMLTLAGCGTTSGVGYALFGTRVQWVEKDGNGGVIASHFSNHSLEKVRFVAEEYCKQRQMSVTTLKLYCAGGLLTFSGCGEYLKYDFRCGSEVNTDITTPRDSVNFTAVPNIENVKDSKVSASDLEYEKKKCLDLGFKTGTEKFGECVLRLSK